MKARIKETDLSVPQREGHYYYYSRTVAGQQYPILCRKRGSLTAPGDVMLDENASGAGAGRGDFLGGGSAVSPVKRKLALPGPSIGRQRLVPGGMGPRSGGMVRVGVAQ